jgi:hypothetical protein
MVGRKATVHSTPPDVTAPPHSTATRARDDLAGALAQLVKGIALT